MREIPIEQRDASEVAKISGKTMSGEISEIQITPEGSNAANYAFDVTPSRLVTGLITERGISDASSVGLKKLFPKFS